jgi:hypothetical protein
MRPFHVSRIVTRTFLAAAAALCVAAPAWGEPTNVTVRVLARDAKFIGTGVGGVGVTLKDADTGEVLAAGKTEGGTGDTGRIMRQDHKRGMPLASEGTAAFSATLDLDVPRRIEVTAIGPLGPPRAATRVSAVQWVVPGKHLTGGDGWVLEMPGFVVQAQAPPARVTLEGGAQAVNLVADVTMMCGCPIEPGGLWDANRYEVAALVRRDGKPAGRAPLHYAGTRNRFAGSLSVEAPGTYEATIYAYDPETGNTGVDKVTFTVTAP